MGLSLSTFLIQSAYHSESEQRRQAEANFQQARQAVDQMLTSTADRLAHYPEMSDVRRELLEEALAFYNGFLEQRSDDPAVRKETALAYARRRRWLVTPYRCSRRTTSRRSARWR